MPQPVQLQCGGSKLCWSSLNNLKSGLIRPHGFTSQLTSETDCSCVHRRAARHLLPATAIHGARAVLARQKREGHAFGGWLDRLETRVPRNVAIVALANNLARMHGRTHTRPASLRHRLNRCGKAGNRCTILFRTAATTILLTRRLERISILDAE
jgi:hypothetical protein